ncbi:MAG: hypothetical protein CME71_04445 [Halobacteriovorax sp.]|nr:hypothetical protein [Halobacteriovorax sp.]|tara:strand:+ start:257 stop:1057 length:801 start_codon:yes stop_codon:yes gene_type:complete
MTNKGEFFQALRDRKQLMGAAKLAHKLFAASPWYIDGVLKLGDQPALQSKPLATPKMDSEKVKTLESLKSFADQKLEETPGAKIEFPGGEVAAKEGALVGRKISISDKAKLPSWTNQNIKIIFYGESSKLGDPSQASGTRAAELLDKMVSAMKIPEDQVLKLLSEEKLEESSEFFESFMKGLLFSRPAFVVSLGALATNTLIGRKEKLTRIHGQFFPIKIESGDDKCQIQLMPLFHPDFLLINPNMKRTAWIDLQKIMSEFEISSP